MPISATRMAKAQPDSSMPLGCRPPLPTARVQVVVEVITLASTQETNLNGSPHFGDD